jgi:hypothetical protein
MRFSIFEIIQLTLMVSGFVLSMMLIIEFINVKSKGKWTQSFQKSVNFQLIVSCFLGIIPGCAGDFVVVSLYIHKIISFAALLTCTIVTIGDEAFLMLALIPFTAVKLTVILTILGLVSGILADKFFKNITFIKKSEFHFQTHEDEEGLPFVTRDIFKYIRKISTQRILIIGAIFILVLSQLIDKNFNFNSINWELLLFFGGCTVSIYIILIVPDHFLSDHLWKHVIKKHFLKLFTWTLLSLIVIAFIYNKFNVEQWVHNNLFYVLLISVLIGIIPISGPHVIFITLFASGIVPFGILLANSIVQEGHGGLPLIAESKKSFAAVKLIKIPLALIIGAVCYYLGA